MLAQCALTATTTFILECCSCFHPSHSHAVEIFRTIFFNFVLNVLVCAEGNQYFIIIDANEYSMNVPLIFVKM